MSRFQQFVKSRTMAAVDKMADGMARKAAEKPAMMVQSMARMAGMVSYGVAYQQFRNGITGDMKKAHKKGETTPEALAEFAVGQWPGFYDLLKIYGIEKDDVMAIAEGILKED